MSDSEMSGLLSFNETSRFGSGLVSATEMFRDVEYEKSGFWMDTNTVYLPTSGFRLPALVCTMSNSVEKMYGLMVSQVYILSSPSVRTARNLT